VTLFFRLLVPRSYTMPCSPRVNCSSSARTAEAAQGLRHNDHLDALVQKASLGGSNQFSTLSMQEHSGWALDANEEVPMPNASSGTATTEDECLDWCSSQGAYTACELIRPRPGCTDCRSAVCRHHIAEDVTCGYKHTRGNREPWRYDARCRRLVHTPSCLNTSLSIISRRGLMLQPDGSLSSQKYSGWSLIAAGGGEWYVVNHGGQYLSSSSVNSEAPRGGDSQSWTVTRASPGKFWFSNVSGQHLSDHGEQGGLVLHDDKAEWQEWVVQSSDDICYHCNPCIATSMVCTSEGDPHVHTWDGTKTNPMGVGEYVLAKSKDGKFAVHACHTAVGDPSKGISANKAFAIKTPDFPEPLYVDGKGWAIPRGLTSVKHLGQEIALPGGEVISASGNSISMSLPTSKYAGNVEGLCSHFGEGTEPFVTAKGERLDEDLPEKWGGPMGGKYQSVFVESYKVASDAPEALFSESVCPRSETVVPVTGVPFAGCPDLVSVAKALCPAGRLHTSCIEDVGATCDVTYIEKANAAQQELRLVDLSCIVDNQDIWGHDLELIKGVKSAAVCQMLCKENDKCEHFSYGKEHTPHFGWCWLKTSSDNSFRWEHRVSGPKSC